MSINTDTYPTTLPTAVVTAPHPGWRTTFVALGLATLLGIGAGVGAAALLDNGSGSVTRPPTTAAATATATRDANTLYLWLAQLPTTERDHVLVNLIHDPTSALRAVVAGEVAGMVAAAG